MLAQILVEVLLAPQVVVLVVLVGLVVVAAAYYGGVRSVSSGRNALRDR